MHRFMIVASILATALVVPTTATARTSLCATAHPVRLHVIERHGKRAPGRDICRYGVRSPRGVRKATTHEKASYLRALRRLLRPPRPFLRVTVGPPPVRPAGTLTARVSATGLAGCIVAHESGGNPGAVNGQYSGIAQWSAEAWARHGGTRYASSPLGATKQQQLIVLSQGLSRYGCRDWCPYDGC